MPAIRINGLVRLMRWARAELAAGIAPERADAFRAAITQSLRQVDSLLGRYRVPPSDLPRPSFEAYQFLKSVDLIRLPPPKPKAPARRSNSPIGVCQSIQDELCARLPALHSGATAVQTELLAHVQAARGSLESALRKRGLQIQDLAAPSQRAAAWLTLLCDPDHLALHLHALERLDVLARRALKTNHSIRVTLYNTPNLYRMDRRKDGVELIVHEGFVGAPDEVLEALVGAALSRPTDRRKQLVRAYAAGADFLDLARRMSAAGCSDQPSPVGGNHHLLEQAFERVNRVYFAGSLPRPRLTWSRRVTYREFGHYQPSTDAVSISRSLDQPAVPEFVLDFVMYHELLHKQLGIKTNGSRQYAHTPEFHNAEKHFARYTEAKDFLDEYSKRLRTTRK